MAIKIDHIAGVGAGEGVLADDHQIGKMGAARQFFDLIAGHDLEFIGKVAARELIGDGLGLGFGVFVRDRPRPGQKSVGGGAAGGIGRHGDRVDRDHHFQIIGDVPTKIDGKIQTAHATGIVGDVNENTFDVHGQFPINPGFLLYCA